MKLKLYYCTMTFNRLSELQQLKTLHAILPYVDQAIIVDGSCGEDGTYDWVMEEFPNSPIMFINSRWSDDFPGQRTHYLNLVGDLAKEDEDAWVVVSDTDEVFSSTLARNLRKLVEMTINDKRTMLQIRSKSVTVASSGKRVYENMDDFYKPLVFKYYKGMKYWGDRSKITGNKTALHEALQLDGKFVWKPIKLDDKDGKLCYEHIKQEGIVWERGLRNFIVMGGGPNLGAKQPLWKPFRELLAAAVNTDEYTSYDIIEYFKKGNINKKVKDWMIAHRNEQGYDGASEVAECFKSYFLLYHPEELPDDLREEYADQIKER